MPRFESKYAKCPFYRCETDSKVYCEGVVDKSYIHLVFGGGQDKRAYEKSYCDVDYTRCKICQMLMSKYPEGDDK